MSWWTLAWSGLNTSFSWDSMYMVKPFWVMSWFFWAAGKNNTSPIRCLGAVNASGSSAGEVEHAPAEPTPLVELVREDEALGVLQRGVFPLVSQEVAQLGGGEHAAVAGIVPEDGVKFGPPQQLPAELLDLYVVQATVSGSVAPLGEKKQNPRIKQNGLYLKKNS